METEKPRKNIPALVHLGGIFFSVIPALLALFLDEGSSEENRKHYNAALNFQILMLIINVVISAVNSVLVFMAVPLYPILWLVNLVICIRVAMNAKKGETPNYPVNIDLLNF